MPFRETPWGQQSPPPWFFPGTVLRGFALPASLERLDEWCRTMLNGVTDDVFTPAAPAAFLYVVHYPRMVVEGYEELGFSVQNEYFLMFPVVRLLEGLVPIELGWTFPFMGVDNGMSAISGQTVVGLPKTLGTIAVTGTPNGDFSADVDMLALPAFGGSSELGLRRLVEVRARDRVFGAAEAVGSFPGGALLTPAITALMPPQFLHLTDLAGMDLTGGCFALRQIRDPGTRGRASLTDLVRMRWRSDNERDVALWGAAEVDLFPNATFPLIDALGLTGGVPLPGGGHRFASLVSWEMTLDLHMSAVVLTE